MDKLYSFDVFDTCITRTYTRPHDLFLELARSVLTGSEDAVDDNAVRLLAKQRQLAETRARTFSTREDILIHDIYDQLSSFRDIAFDLDTMFKNEIKLELKSAVPVRKTLALYKSIQEQSRRIIFISDIYLPEELVIAMLSQCGFLASTDNLYISGKVGLTKRSGNLYKHVLNIEGIAPSNLTHYGDNVVADIKMAKSAGVNAVHLPFPTKQSRYEHIFVHQTTSWQRLCDNLQKHSRHLRKVYRDPLAQLSVEKQISLSRTNATSRILLRNIPDGDSNDIELFAIGYFVAAPLFVGFVLWLLQIAQEKK